MSVDCSWGGCSDLAVVTSEVVLDWSPVSGVRLTAGSPTLRRDLCARCLGLHVETWTVDQLRRHKAVLSIAPLEVVPLDSNDEQHKAHRLDQMEGT